MKRVLFITVALLAVAATAASAQNTVRRSNTSSSMAAPAPRLDLIPMAGYAWTMSMDVWTGTATGELDFKDAAYYGGAIDFNVTPPGSYKVAQVRLMYRRSDSDLQLRTLRQTYSQSGAVEYWQIGGVSGVMRGKALPFGTVSLGATHLITDDATFGSTHVTGVDAWKFSMIFGLGVKVYSSPKVGVMLAANWPITFTDAWGGVYVGTGGASVGISGTGISQLDVGGGLIIRL